MCTSARYRDHPGQFATEFGQLHGVESGAKHIKRDPGPERGPGPKLGPGGIDGLGDAFEPERNFKPKPYQRYGWRQSSARDS